MEEFKRVVQGLKGNEDADSLAGKLGLSGENELISARRVTSKFK